MNYANLRKNDEEIQMLNDIKFKRRAVEIQVCMQGKVVQSQDRKY